MNKTCRRVWSTPGFVDNDPFERAERQYRSFMLVVLVGMALLALCAVWVAHDKSQPTPTAQVGTSGGEFILTRAGRGDGVATKRGTARD